MKTQLFYCLRSIFLIAGILLCSLAQAQVSVVTVIEPGSYGTPSIAALTGDACLSYASGTGVDQTFEITGTGLSSLTYTWSVIGGISLTSTSTNQATVRPFIDSKGRYNKGRLKVLYKGLKDTLVDAGDCDGVPKQVTIQIPKSGVAYVDVYQKFTFDNQIVGNICVAQGDSNAYSIKDLVSGNIADGIGIDSYYWDYTDLTTVPIIDGGSSSYVSGDSSAITFRFIVDPSGGEQILVGVGKCNTSDTKKVKTLGKKLPPVIASLSPSGCIPVTTTQVVISNTTRTGIVYQWVLGNSNFTYASGSSPSSQSGITVNIGTYAGDIYLISTPDPAGSNYCGDNGKRVDTLHIIRSLDNSVSVSGPSCVAPGTYTYSVSPNPGTSLDWKLPSGFSIVGGASNEHAAIIQVTVASNAVSGNIVASTSDCDADTVYLAVNIKPGNPGAMTGDTCLTPGSTGTQVYSISAVTPAATSYTWTKPSGWSGSSTSTSITLTPDGSTNGFVTVTAIGTNGCNSDTKSITINYLAAKPGTILRAKTTCLNSGTADTVTFTVQTPKSGQYYDWKIPAGWSVLNYNIGTNPDSSKITVKTNGVDGSYYVKVRGYNTCGYSTYDSLLVSIAGEALQIKYYAAGDYYYVSNGTSNQNTNICTTCAYTWTLIDHGSISDSISAFGGANGYKAALDYANSIGDIHDSTHYTLVLDIVKSGCKTRKVYGAPLASNNPGPGFRVSNASVIYDKSSSAVTAIVYPNPAQNLINVTLAGKYKSATLELWNSEGEIVNTTDAQGDSTEIDSTNLQSGTYYLLIKTGDDLIKKKVVILK